MYPRTLIICGAKRSGTTLMERLLDGIECTFNFLDESFFFEYLYDIGEENIKAFIDVHKSADVEELIDGAKRRQLFLFFEGKYSQGAGTVNKQTVQVKFDDECLLQSLKVGLRSGKHETVSDIWHLWAEAFCKAMNYSYETIKTIVVKSPDYGKSAIMGQKYLENCLAIFMIRNPYYAIDSLKRSREMRGLKLHTFELINVCRDYRLLLNTVTHLKEKDKEQRNNMTIKYEDFVQDPEATMRRVAEFMSVPFSSDFLRPTMNGQEWYGLSSFDMLNGISKKPVARKIKVLNQWEIDTIGTQLLPFFRYFGYPLSVLPAKDE